MRKFSITVNGQAYQVEVEEIGAAPVYASAPAPAPVAGGLLGSRHPIFGGTTREKRGVSPVATLIE